MRSSGKFSFILLSSLVVVLQMLMLQASGSVVDVAVDPAWIQIGEYPSLDVNCTFDSNETSAMAAIFSLTVSRGDDDSELASITRFADHKVNLISNEGFTADGAIDTEGVSFLHLHWEYPTDTQNGTYKCIARGIDEFGHNVETVNISVANVDELYLQDLVSDFKQMQAYINQLEQRIQSLEYENQYGLSVLFYLPPLTHKNKKYYVSKQEFLRFQDAIDMCKYQGGMLLEIDDKDEYQAVVEYLNDTFTGAQFLHIGGIDRNGSGNLVLPSTNQSLPYTEWHDGEGNRHHDCLCLGANFGWKMFSCGSCNMAAANFRIRYVCEMSVD